MMTDEDFEEMEQRERQKHDDKVKELENIRLCHYCMSPLPDDCEYICPCCKWLEAEE